MKFFILQTFDRMCITRKFHLKRTAFSARVLKFLPPFLPRPSYVYFYASRFIAILHYIRPLGLAIFN